MKKVLIVSVCLALVLTLAFTLGALGKKPPDKPEKPGKLEYVYELTFKKVKGLDVTGTVKHCGTQGRFISSSNIDRPTLTLSKTFKTLSEDYSGEHDGQYLDLSEHKGEITMQFFFFYNGEKVQLNVYGGYVLEGEKEWLSKEFTIVFDDSDNAVILPTKGKRDPLWGPGSVNIIVVCGPQE